MPRWRCCRMASATAACSSTPARTLSSRRSRSTSVTSGWCPTRSASASTPPRPAAVVTHDLLVGGAPALVAQESVAVEIDGTWFVASTVVVCRRGPRRRDLPVTFIGLMFSNLRVKPLRTVLTAIAVSIGVASGVTLGIVTHSLRTDRGADPADRQRRLLDHPEGCHRRTQQRDRRGRTRRRSRRPRPRRHVPVCSSLRSRISTADNPMFLADRHRHPDRLEEFGVRVVDGVPSRPRRPTR